MKIINFNYGATALIVVVMYFIFRLIQRRLYFKFISEHWLKKQSKSGMVYFFLNILFWFIMAFSILDLRGPEIKINVKVPDQKTLILIDTSLSMLVEDVRPSRFERALILARHFVKNTYNGQVGIVLFSDYQKKYVPFTDDIDLLDSRLAALSDSELIGGGSNINQAILESMAYLKEFNSDLPIGNILVFTDGEDHEPFALDENYENISLSVVGLGTLNGGPIPLRDIQKRFTGHKEENSKKIVSKLNEEGIRKLNKTFPNFKYWIASNYGLPTEEINRFFNKNFERAIRNDSVSSRPVLTHYFVIGAILTFLLSILFYYLKSMRVTSLIVIFLLPESIAYAEANIIEKFKEKNLTREEKMYLASKLIEQKDFKSAKTLYQESKISEANDDPRNIFNYGTSLLAEKNLEMGIDVLKKLRERMGEKSEYSEKINQNILHYLNESKKEEKRKSEEQKRKSGSDNKSHQEKNEGKSGQGQSQGESSEGTGKSDMETKKPESKESEEEKEDKKKSEVDKKSSKTEEQESSDNKEEDSLEKKQQKEKQRRAQVKIPGLLKQLLNDDKNLQKRMFGTMNSEHSDLDKKKDW